MLQTKIKQLDDELSGFKISGLHQAILIAFSFGFTGAVYAAEAPTDNTATVDEKDVQQLANVVVVGNRGGIRTVTESPSPVDVISGEQLEKEGATSVKDVLIKLVPSFSVATVPSHINGYGAVARSAGLRTFGGGHTLVLVNGKRRHVGALSINKYGFGEGYQAADLDLIPASAIARIEVLRDGAAAQYGSDAIAGVINVVLKSADHGGLVSASYGGREHYEHTKRNGETFQATSNLGLPLGQEGFINFGFAYKNQDATTRAGAATANFYSSDGTDPREKTVDRYINKLGLPSNEQYIFSYNAELPLTEAITAYSFTTAGWREAATGESIRYPKSSQSIVEIYPNGTVPEDLLDEKDYQSVWGLKGDNLFGWQWDVSSSYGKNIQEHATRDNFNPSLREASPTYFALQRYEAFQWVNNLDVKREFDLGFIENPLSVAWGLDYRKEGWKSKSLDPLAYINGGKTLTAGDYIGQPASVGVVAATRLRPENEADITRSNTAAYLDLGLDVAKDWFVGLAGRFEHYDDSAGDTFNGKVTTRYAFTPELAVRGTFSTGFIAPSLYQQGDSSELIGNGIINNVRTDIFSQTVKPDSAIGQRLGAQPLEPTKSKNYSLGLTFSPTKNINVAIDAYRIELKDRIALTAGLREDAVSSLLSGLNYSKEANTINQFSYYANLFDTKTTGVDVVANYTQQLQDWGRIRWSLGFNWNETKITGKANTPSQLAGLGVNAQPIDHRIEGILTEGDPKTKLTLGANWQYNNFDINTRITRYGSYVAADTNPIYDQKFGGKWIADLDATYHVTDNLSLTLGADNIFNTYPDKSHIVDSSGENIYSQISPFGLYGGYYYGRVNYKF